MVRLGYVSGGTSAHHDMWTDVLREPGHQVIRYPDATVTDLRRAAARDHIDLFVAGPLTAAVPAVEAGAVPVVGISWASDLLVDACAPATADALRRTLPHLSALHLDSHSLVPIAVGLGADAGRISVAPWGIDVETFAPDPARPARDERIVFSGRSWEAIYDVPVVIGGFALALHRDPRLRLVLAGDGSDSGAVHEAIDRAGLRAEVDLVGRLTQAQVLAQLRRADAYVSASRSDGTSLSLLEALAVGVPAVVTDLPGNREWVHDAAIGATFEPGDDLALAKALTTQLASDTATARAARRRLVRERGDRRVAMAVFASALQRVTASVDHVRVTTAP